MGAVQPDFWMQFGVLGAVFLLIITGVLVPGSFHKQRVDDIKQNLAEERQENKELRQAVSSFSPLMQSALEILRGLKGGGHSD
ncbi:MAG: hypothetical protein ACYCX4_11090 [Bacillota bacterium]